MLPATVNIDDFESSVCEHTIKYHDTQFLVTIPRYSVHIYDVHKYGFMYTILHSEHYLDLYMGTVCNHIETVDNIRWVFAVHEPNLGSIYTPRFARVIKMN